MITVELSAQPECFMLWWLDNLQCTITLRQFYEETSAFIESLLGGLCGLHHQRCCNKSVLRKSSHQSWWEYEQLWRKGWFCHWANQRKHQETGSKVPLSVVKKSVTCRVMVITNLLISGWVDCFFGNPPDGRSAISLTNENGYIPNKNANICEWIF